MVRDRESNVHVLPVLIAGFALLVLLIIASAYVEIGAIRSVETDTSNLLRQQRAAIQLIDDVQREEESLNSVFYNLAAGVSAGGRQEELAKLDVLQAAIHRATEAGTSATGSDVWRHVLEAANAFIAEGRRVLNGGGRPSPAFFQTHEALATATAELANTNLKSMAGEAVSQSDRSQGRVRFSLILLGIAVVIACAGAVFSIYTVHGMFRRLRWQAAELSHLSSRTMSDQEAIARRFSHELHDHFGQILGAIEANLVAMRLSSGYAASRIEDCLALTKDGIDHIREMAQLLRPSILDDFGLDAGLSALAGSFSERNGLVVDYRSSFSGRLGDETETQLYRIAQEGLTNIAKHSGATHVVLALEQDNDSLRMTMADNGHGFSGQKSPSGLGLVGMRARARKADAEISIQSSERGVTIRLELPLPKSQNAQEKPHLVS